MAVGVAVDDGIAIADGVHLNLADSKFRVFRLNEVAGLLMIVLEKSCDQSLS